MTLRVQDQQGAARFPRSRFTATRPKASAPLADEPLAGRWEGLPFLFRSLASAEPGYAGSDVCAKIPGRTAALCGVWGAAAYGLRQ
jgi:hypothetical protein